GVAYQLGGLRRGTVGGDLVAPQAHLGDAGGHASGHQVGQWPVFGGGLVEGKPLQAGSGTGSHSAGTSIRQPSRAERKPSSASCTPRATAHRSCGLGTSSATCRRNSSHWALNPLSNSSLSGTVCHCARKFIGFGTSGSQTGFGVAARCWIRHSRRPATAEPSVPSTWN